MPQDLNDLTQVVAFLNGEAPLDGVWFDEGHPTKKGAYWWRKHLCAALAQSEAQPERELVAWKAVDEWASRHRISFVSRSSGQYTTSTISRDALAELAAPQPAAPAVPLTKDAFAAGAASRDAEIAELVADATRYRFLRKFLSSKDLPILTGRGERDEPDEQYAMDCVVDAAAREVKP